MKHEPPLLQLRDLACGYGEQSIVQHLNPHDARQMGVADLMVEPRTGSTVRELAAPLGLALVLIVKLARPMGRLLLQFLDAPIALGA